MTPIAIRTRLTLVYAGVLAVLLGAFGFTAYKLLAAQLDTANTADLQELTEGLHGYLRVENGEPSFAYDRNDPAQAAFVNTATRFYQIYDLSSGALLVKSPAIEPLALEFTPTEVRQYAESQEVRVIQTDQGRLRFSSTVIRPDAEHAYLLQVGVLLRAMDRALAEFRNLLLWSIPVCVIVVSMVGWWMAGRSLAPLRALARTARTIGVDALDERLPVRGSGDEPDQVALAFNETLARLEHSVGEMRQFSAALAHELRAPLAAFRAEIELVLMKPRTPEEYERSLESQLEELDKLSRMVSQLLTLARAESGEITLDHSRVDLSALARSLTSQLDVVADAKHVTLTCVCEEDVFTMGDEGWLERLVLNLIDNAIKFTPGGGRVTIETTIDGGEAVLSVRDTGIGIPREHLPHVFDRFYRADPARSPQIEGTGLGLTLAKWIADRHHAAIAAESDGSGTVITVRFPSAIAR